MEFDLVPDPLEACLVVDPEAGDLLAEPLDACLVADPELGDLLVDPLDACLVADPELGDLLVDPLEACLVAEPFERDFVVDPLSAGFFLMASGSTVSKTSFRLAGRPSLGAKALDCEPDFAGLAASFGLLIGFGLDGFLKSATTGFSAGRGIVSVGASVWLGAGLRAFPSVLEPDPANELEIILLVPAAIGEIVFGRMIELPGC